MARAMVYPSPPALMAPIHGGVAAIARAGHKQASNTAIPRRLIAVFVLEISAIDSRNRLLIITPSPGDGVNPMCEGLTIRDRERLSSETLIDCKTAGKLRRGAQNS